MKQIDKLRVFISYSHLDETHITEFRKHMSPLKTNGLVEDWYDRNIIAGQDFQDHINSNLEDADIVCLFISANFLSSNACMKEKRNAFALKKRKGIAIIPVILSASGWSDDIEISSLLALPTDGKPISQFADSNDAWTDVYRGLKKLVEQEIRIRQLCVREPFLDSLQNTELLAKAHSHKDRVLLEDIFVYPDLWKYDDLGEYEKRDSSEGLIDELCDSPKILIAGGDQSGKTTLCKRLFLQLRERNYVPVYISLRTNHEQGKMENQISRAYEEQYAEIPIEDIDRQRIVPIVDDFHLAKHKEKHILHLSSYVCQIVVVDDILSLNIKAENIIKSFVRYKIAEFTPSLRNRLITKWTSLSDGTTDDGHYDNTKYESIDHATELVNTALGKAIGGGIMPAYPFFILSVISIYETFERPLDQEITSQGFCYQALIYMYLRKQGVRNDEIDTYVNYLTEFAFFFYNAKKNELSKGEFESFMQSYYKKYNLPVKQQALLKNLRQTQIIALDAFGNWSFCYPYLYYFFVAKYLAEHVEDNRDIIDGVIHKLHKDENAYIAIFLTHHSKNDHILDETIATACKLFDRYKPATLSKEELRFFDDQVEIIAKATLPPAHVTPEMERAKRLEVQDVEEEISGDESKNMNQEQGGDDDLVLELRRSIKTVEVMGGIIKNRAGSLEKARLESIFEVAMRVHLRILTSFFELIKGEEQQQEIVKFISDRLNVISEHKEHKERENQQKPKPLDREAREKLSKIIFWNLNFRFVYSLIGKIVQSLGSNKLTSIIAKVCSNENTPASFLLMHGMLMWYNKNLQVDNIKNRIDEPDFSRTSINVMKHMIANYCSMHAVGYSKMQKIEIKFGIPRQRLLKQQIP